MGVIDSAAPAAAPRPACFSGSYDPDDCIFLLKPLAVEDIAVADKERLIQSGARHYSEMLAPEAPPTPPYLALFRDLVLTYAARVGQDVLSLAAHVAKTLPRPLTAVSLARAGTPVGALLVRALRARWDPDARHYSISIVRDRGIDRNALRHILYAERRPAAGVFFVDGWTAKGVIAAELRRAVAEWNAGDPQRLDPSLYVLCDIGGVADRAASFEDYAIPSGVLNATVSGLVSRSILNERIGPQDFHGCRYYRELADIDRSRWYLDRVSETFSDLSPRPLPERERMARAHATAAWVERCMREHAIADRNLIKPGVAEATRVFLRRVPERLLVRDPGLGDVRHLVGLAEERCVPIERDPELPFLAAALIRSFRGVAGAPPSLRSREP